jgi:hypothetical protein
MEHGGIRMCSDGVVGAYRQNAHPLEGSTVVGGVRRPGLRWGPSGRPLSTKQQYHWESLHLPIAFHMLIFTDEPLYSLLDL